MFCDKETFVNKSKDICSIVKKEFNIFEDMKINSIDSGFLCCIMKLYLNENFKNKCKCKIDYLTLYLDKNNLEEQNTIYSPIEEVYFDNTKEGFRKALDKVISQLKNN
jgi:hypothetical protein